MGDRGDPAQHLGVFGTNGLTAYFDLFSLGEPKPGQTMLVSAATSAVGLFAWRSDAARLKRVELTHRIELIHWIEFVHRIARVHRIERVHRAFLE